MLVRSRNCELRLGSSEVALGWRDEDLGTGAGAALRRCRSKPKGRAVEGGDGGRLVSSSPALLLDVLENGRRHRIDSLQVGASSEMVVIGD
jgi:hypothetical protein